MTSKPHPISFLRPLLQKAALGLALLGPVLAAPARSEPASKASLNVSVSVPTIAANAADVASVDGLMRAFYAVVNVRPDGQRLWARDRTLYSPWVRFIGTSISASGTPEVVVWDHQQLVDASEPLVQRGFSETEIHRSTRSYGNIAHVDSTYEAVLDGPNSPQRFRGVNSIELYFDGQRWWIASVMWMSEAASHPIPASLLPDR
ncbi:hypothetical protein [Roseateles oligotrophus]|uniref:Nuclear transport factor 2 family protein n=1 Tax=Roseateles oligotrophus TaxID=1769250 RepID=A0ABT2YL24_9BURK|nr:hypothetical protein [Roseateles oligotrophus]MCV2370758.1 hypothetical protein [Roseateles oligotrophus]